MRVVVAFPAGGGTDIIARLLQDPLQAALGGAMVIVENRSGGSGMIAAEHVARSPADGTTLLMTITTIFQAPVVLRRFPYDPVKDFSFIGRVGTGSITFMVGPAVPASITTLPQFVDGAAASRCPSAITARAAHPRLLRGLRRGSEAGRDACRLSRRGADAAG